MIRFEIKHKKDFYAGLIFIMFGTIALLEVRTYLMGTAANMGPGYFPCVLGFLQILLGLILLVRSLLLGGESMNQIHLHLIPVLVVTIAVSAFVFMIESLGLVLATLSLVFISYIGYSKFKLREAVCLCIALVVFTVVVFVYFLKIPIAVWP